MDPHRALRVLGLASGASAEDVRTAWRDLARVWHPDRFGNDERLRAKADENLKRINEAYEALKDGVPAAPAGALRRITQSFSAVLGLGDLRPSGTMPSATPDQPVNPPPAAFRRSLHLLFGQEPARRHRRRPRWPAAIAVVLLALAAVAAFFVLRR